VSDLRTATVEELRRMVDDALGRERGVDPLNELARRAATSDPAPLDAETLARALASYLRSGQTSCGVLHLDGYGNPAPCPDGPIIEAEAIIRRYQALRDTTGREPQP
jgi:hypothetical protein